MAERVNYDQVAPRYDRRYAENDYSGIERTLDRFVDGAEGAQSVLEVGCGTGHWVERLRSRGHHAVGLDRSPGMLSKAAQRIGDEGLVLGRAEALPFPEHTFERVVVINAMHHFDDPARFSREAFRVLRPGGRVLVIGLDPSRRDERWYVYEYFPRTLELDRARFPSTPQIETWFETAGFRECAVEVAQRIPMTGSAREYLDRGSLTKEWTSQLTLLDDEEFAEGVARIRAAIDRAAAAGEDLQLHADLSLYATYGTTPGVGLSAHASA